MSYFYIETIIYFINAPLIVSSFRLGIPISFPRLHYSGQIKLDHHFGKMSTTHKALTFAAFTQNDNNVFPISQ